VQGNLIGTDINGTANLGNGTYGVIIQNAATDNTIGGTTTGAANVISGNGLAGVVIATDGTSGNLVLGNLIGTDKSGTAKLGNPTGVAIISGATDNTVGGTVSGAANVISGNGIQGVYINGDPSNTSGNVVLGNLIGTDKSGTAKLGNGNQGVFVGGSGATANTIGGTVPGTGNVIAFNGEGIVASGASTTGDSFLGNSIFGNFGLGIDLGSPPANHGQPAPVLTSVSGTASTTVVGTLTAPPGTYRLEFFASPFLLGGSPAQGKVFLGSATLPSPRPARPRSPPRACLPCWRGSRW
jgi:titin